jgi:hypothetical protein
MYFLTKDRMEESTRDLNTEVENVVLGVSRLFQLPKVSWSKSNLQA